jgi:hypothetical protein
MILEKWESYKTNQIKTEKIKCGNSSKPMMIPKFNRSFELALSQLPFFNFIPSGF